jgi:hypothetical protein
MITAQEARTLAGKTIEELGLDCDPHIRKAAEAKKREVTFYHGELENDAYSRTPRWNDFVAYMKELGFEVSLYYQESQFVDMRITIKWT